MFLIERLEVDGLRGLKGEVELGPGLNLIMGPNNSGKTTLLEAILSSLLLSLEDFGEAMDFFIVLEAARGSLRHSLSSVVPKNTALVCSTIRIGDRVNEECVRTSKNEETLTLPSPEVPVLTGRVLVSIENVKRDRKVDIILERNGMLLNFKGGTSSVPLVNKRVSVIPSGVLPYNHMERLLGRIKVHDPDRLKALAIKLGEREYGLDLATDEWGDPLVFVKYGNALIPFYSIGRGFQRAFQILMSGTLYDIFMVDEIESAMHPELLAQVVESLVNLAKDKQIILTTQSLEAALMLASSFLGLKPTTDREAILHKIEEQGDLEGFNLVITDVRDGKLLSATLRGKVALRHLAGSEDTRLSYKLL